MIENLAVILIGQYRSWPVASRYILDFFKPRATNVDYFFVTWETDWNGNPVSVDEILTHFNGATATIKLIPDIKETTTFYRAAYLAKQGNILKKRKEIAQNFVYDQVVETRHDVYLRSNQHPWMICLDFEYQIGEINSRDNAQKINPLVMADLYIRSNSFTNDILSNRYVKSNLMTTKKLTEFDQSSNLKFTDNHHLLADYVMEKRLTQIASRPDYDFVLNIRKDPKTDLNLVPLNKLDDVIVLCNFV